MVYELDEIKKIRKRFGLTQTDLAKRANVSQSLIAKIESNRIDPTFTKVKRIFDVLDELKNKNESSIREWLVKNIKGIGWKEASHFLRNMGFQNFAILDRHVLRVLNSYKILDGILPLTRKNYLEIERKLKRIADRLNISLAELDLHLFYIDTKKIPKK